MDQRGVIDGVQGVSHADGSQSNDMIEHPAFIGITLQEESRASSEPIGDSVDALVEERFVSRLLLERPARGQH